jgi:hypothetical protein
LRRKATLMRTIKSKGVRPDQLINFHPNRSPRSTRFVCSSALTKSGYAKTMNSPRRL